VKLRIKRSKSTPTDVQPITVLESCKRHLCINVHKPRPGPSVSKREPPRGAIGDDNMLPMACTLKGT